MDRISINIIPATVGFKEIYEDDKKLFLGDDIIAWRFETYSKRKGDMGDTFVITFPLTVDGDIVSNCIGLQNPDGTVIVFNDRTCGSLQELKQEWYGEKGE